MEDLSELLRVYRMLGKKVDREVAHQYLQNWEIAKEFANYLELYEKYKKDYGLEKIVQGIYGEDVLEKLKFAAFDERFSIVDVKRKACRVFPGVPRGRCQNRTAVCGIKSIQRGAQPVSSD